MSSYVTAARNMPVHRSEDGTPMTLTPEDVAAAELSRVEAVAFLEALTPAQVLHLEAMLDGWSYSAIGAEAQEATTLTDYLVVLGSE